MSGLQVTDNIVQSDTSTKSVNSGDDIEQRQNGEPDFPRSKLAMLDEKISSPRWVVPVLPEQELECLMQASIDLCRKSELNEFSNPPPPPL